MSPAAFPTMTLPPRRIGDQCVGPMCALQATIGWLAGAGPGSTSEPAASTR